MIISDELGDTTLFGKKLAIDLGSSNTRIYLKNKRVVLNEPSLVAQDNNTEKIVAVGLEAFERYNNLPEHIELIHPVVNGVIANFSAAEHMLAYFLHKSSGRVHINKPEAMITVPSGATSTEQRAVIDVGHRAGLNEVYLIPNGVAAALGAGLPIIEPRGFMVIDIGSETSEVSVLSLGGVVANRSLRIGSKTITESIMRYLKRDHGIVIGFNTAEEIKRLVGSLSDTHDQSGIKINGKTVGESRIKSINITSTDIFTYLENNIERIILSTRSTLEKTPPDLVADIADIGITLTGGGSQLNGLAEYLSVKLNANCKVAQDPMLCGVKGAHLALSHLADYKRSLIGL